MATLAEENYIKSIYKIVERESGSASTTAISRVMQTAAASVTDMLKKLSSAGLIHYEKYRGVTLTEDGRRLATDLVRKHRLWETFLSAKLGFSWDQVHDIAEELEHVQSDELISRLDAFLGYPKFDPHGDPIPNEEGRFTLRKQILLQQENPGSVCRVVGVKEHTAPFLEHLDALGIALDTELKILEKQAYDNALRIRIGTSEVLVSDEVAGKIYVREANV